MEVMSVIFGCMVMVAMLFLFVSMFNLLNTDSNQRPRAKIFPEHLLRRIGVIDENDKLELYKHALKEEVDIYVELHNRLFNIKNVEDFEEVRKDIFTKLRGFHSMPISPLLDAYKCFSDAKIPTKEELNMQNLTIPSELLSEIELITEDCTDILYTGSRFICNPPVMDTDLDIVLLTNDIQTVHDTLINMGYTWCGEHYDETDFIALRKGTINAILVQDVDVFESWQYATEIATRLNLKSKDKRIKLFKLVREEYVKDKLVSKISLKHSIQEYRGIMNVR